MGLCFFSVCAPRLNSSAGAVGYTLAPFPAAMDAAEVRKSAALRLPAWKVAEDGRSLSRTHQVASFVAGIDWFNAIMPIAEAEGHHPDLHLVDWNTAEVRLSTHVRCLVFFLQSCTGAWLTPST